MWKPPAHRLAFALVSLLMLNARVWADTPTTRGITISVANACGDDTPKSAAQVLPVFQSMSARHGSYECIARDTRTDYTVNEILAFQNKLGAGSVRFTFTPDMAKAYSDFEATNVGKKVVLLKGDRAVLNFNILKARHSGQLVLNTSSLKEAELIERTLLGE